MARHFEDLLVWQKARRLVFQVYEITKERRFADDRSLQNQIRRAAVSVMSNIAEGFERDSRPELARFLAIVKGSYGEIRCQLYVALDLRYIDDKQFHQLAEGAIEISRMLHSLRTRTQRHASVRH